ncbi:MAG: UDP-3-O-(3-hydroxymyristoyl)glucosamine N-acyltransferase [Pirellulales bacterium]|nr:UDP-3-O-(3-hydroxymyristoyl)glucosamine N-acyltransferase [Pirellulales bacterium]
MATTLAELARLVEGEITGDAAVELSGAATLDTADASDISLFDRAKADKHLDTSKACAYVVPNNFEDNNVTAIRVADVHAAFAAIVKHFRPQRNVKRTGVSPHAIISESASLADDVDVHAFATVGDDVVIATGVTIHQGVHIASGSKIGAGTTIFPNVVLYENTIVGENVIVHAGAVIGAYGFGYDSSSGEHVLSAQLGYVHIEDNVEIGAGTTIDRGTYGPTTIGEGTKIDNLVMIAHNCQIGRRNMLCSQVGIAGSTTTGAYVVMAGQVGVRDHVHIGDGATLGAMCGVSNDIPAGESVLGAPAVPVREQKLRFGAVAKLPEMRKQLKQLQQTVAALEAAQQTQPTKPESHAA